MKTGTLEFFHRLHCPYCGNTEDADEVGQYENFQLIEVDDPGTFQIWECLNCNEQFRIILHKKGAFMTISVEQAVGIDQVKMWKGYIFDLAEEKGIILSDRQIRKYLQECIRILLQSYSDAARWSEFLGDEFLN